MGLPTPPPARADGLTIWTTEGGVCARASSGALAVAVEGLGSEDEAAAAATGALEALAKRRGRLPARVADRHARGLLDALERP